MFKDVKANLCSSRELYIELTLYANQLLLFSYEPYPSILAAYWDRNNQDGVTTVQMMKAFTVRYIKQAKPFDLK